MKRPVIIAALVGIVLAIIIINIYNSNKNSSDDFYISMYAPNSMAYFICRSEGLKEGNKCSKCEELFKNTDSKKAEYKISTERELIEYVKSQDMDCVNSEQGGN